MAIVVAVISGVVFGLLPARRAARLDPVAALAGRR
jgi:putative ABC transport system permease protein